MISVKLVPEMVMQIIEIKINNIKKNKAHITQSRGCYFSATSTQTSFEAQ